MESIRKPEDNKFRINFPSHKSRNPDFKELVLEKMERQFFMHHNGIKLTVIEEGYVEAEASLEKILTQQDGFLHGGVTSTLADIVCGFAAFTLVEPHVKVVTSNLNVSYLNPGKGSKVLARGYVVKPGKRVNYCEAEIWVIDGKKETLVARANSIMASFQPGQSAKGL